MIDFGQTVGEVVDKGRKYTHHYGVEFELEGSNLPDAVLGWTTTHDGSLREGGIEYVTAKPLELERVLEAIDRMEEATKKSKIFNTGYAGTHVHVNVSDLTITQMFSFALLFLALEDVIADKY